MQQLGTRLPQPHIEAEPQKTTSSILKNFHPLILSHPNQHSYRLSTKRTRHPYLVTFPDFREKDLIYVKGQTIYSIMLLY